MVYPIEEPIEIQIDCPLIALGDVAPRALDRLVGRAAGAKAEASLREAGVEDRGERLRDCLLDQTIGRRWHPQFPLPSVGLWDRGPAGGFRSVGARLERMADLGPVVMKP